jgi:cytosine/adenosine deaminase-related metal-dependent hydrolase
MKGSSDLLIRGGMVVAHDGRGHRLIRDGFVRVRDALIVDVGRGSGGAAARVIDARDGLVIPGLIDAHCHLTDTPYTRGFLEDGGSRGLGMSGLYEYLPAVRRAIGPEDELAAVRFGLLELLKSGVTTVVELGYNTEVPSGGNLEVAEEIVTILGGAGIRAYVGARYKSGHFYAGDDGQVAYEWYSDAGRSRFEECVAFASRLRGRYEGRIQPMLAPAQVDTCTPDLLEATATAAETLGIPVQIHAGQSAAEFRAVLARCGMTPIEFLQQVGLLGPRLIIGHGMFLSCHRAIQHTPDRDLDLIAAAGASVAHCPVVFARRGILLDSFARYLERGINMCLGTDTFPLDMLHEMRVAAFAGKIAAGDPFLATAAEVFEAATLRGAKALGRADLGRIAPGCRADLAIVTLRSPRTAPARDPIKALVYSAGAGDVETVLVDGRLVVDGGRVLGIDEALATEEVQRAAEGVWARTQGLDRLAPLSFAAWEGDAAGSSAP